MAELTDYFPSWGSTGTAWSAGGDWGVEQVSQETMDYLFDKLAKQEANIHSYLEEDGFSPDAGGLVESGDATLLYTHGVADQEQVTITQAGFVESDGTAIPSGCDLVIATLGNETIQTTVISGDGTTVHNDETGAPLASYTNTSGGEQTVAVLVDNGHFTGGSGGAGSGVDHYVTVRGHLE